jgi:hypothetical protein
MTTLGPWVPLEEGEPGWQRFNGSTDHPMASLQRQHDRWVWTVRLSPLAKTIGHGTGLLDATLQCNRYLARCGIEPHATGPHGKVPGVRP